MQLRKARSLIDKRCSVSRLVVFMTICLMGTTLAGCKDRNTSPTSAHWDRIVEGQNNEIYFIDRSAIDRVSDEVVRVSVKYAPTKGQFLISLQELSREFGKEVQDAGQEFTVSTWEFNCTRPEGRCLSLTHFKKGSVVAAYKYPQQPWSRLDRAPSTKVLRDLVCAEILPAKK